MDNSYLPIDVCEHIIDTVTDLNHIEYWKAIHVWSDDLPPTRYSVLCTAALVCSSWRPRAQFNLLSHVLLNNQFQFDLLLRTLTERPSLTCLIVRIDVYPDDNSYIPLHRLAFLGLRPDGIALQLSVDWKYYPPRYLDNALGHLYNHITSLIFWPVRKTSVPALLRFIWALPRLRNLVIGSLLVSDSKYTYPTSCSRGRSESDCTCSVLRTLKLEVSSLYLW